ncbi:MAG: ABC transporter permease [Clostridia bacterium]|nr:ABC transporter permease [Deltaproteobacteria bacterium]
MRIYVIIALRNLLQAKRRTALLSAALVSVTALLVLLTALAGGMSDTMVRTATILMSGHVNVAGFFKAKQADAFPIVTRRDDLRQIVEDNVEGVDYVVDRVRGFARIVSESESIQAALAGIDLTREKALATRLQLAKQSEYRDGGRDEVVGDIQGLSKPNTLMLFAAQAKRLDVDVGDSLTIAAQTTGGVTNTAEVRLVAVAQDIGMMSNFSVFTPGQVVRDVYQMTPDTTGSIMVYLRDQHRSAKVMGQLYRVLEDKGFAMRDHLAQPFFMKLQTVSSEYWTGQQIDLTTWEDEMALLRWTLTALEMVSTILVSVLVVIIAIGIMNAMWIAVRERTQEIGTLRAIGMQKRSVLAMFVTEALVLGLCATTVGGLLGALASVLIDAARWHIPIAALRAILMSDVLHLSVAPLAVLAAVLVFTVVAVLAALWPATRAARMQPVTAIHHAG